MHLSHDMENMEMKKLAFRMSVPMILSMISIALYNLVALIFMKKIKKEVIE